MAPCRARWDAQAQEPGTPPMAPTGGEEQWGGGDSSPTDASPRQPRLARGRHAERRVGSHYGAGAGAAQLGPGPPGVAQPGAPAGHPARPADFLQLASHGWRHALTASVPSHANPERA